MNLQAFTRRAVPPLMAAAANGSWEQTSLNG